MRRDTSRVRRLLHQFIERVWQGLQAAVWATLRGMSTTYPSNLSDAEWDCLQQLLVPCSRLRRHSLRSLGRPFLSAAYRLPLALLAQQFSALADRVLSLSPILSHWLVDPPL